ncbi:MAG: YfiR family protein [Candidatus Polarisedimenticolia bacterium]
MASGTGAGILPAAPATEYEVKAAYLYYLATFIEWPEGVFASADEPFSVCVLGEDPFGPVLDAILTGKTVHARRLAVRRLASLPAEGRCHLLFISTSEQKRLPRILDGLQDAGVLTVGEMRRFVERGGHVVLRLEERRVRFSINLQAAQRAGLRISAQLLKLATPPAAAPGGGTG